MKTFEQVEAFAAEYKALCEKHDIRVGGDDSGDVYIEHSTNIFICDVDCEDNVWPSKKDYEERHPLQ